MEENGKKIGEEEYLDLTKSFVKREVSLKEEIEPVELKRIVEKKVESPYAKIKRLPKTNFIPQEIPNKNNKQKKKINLFSVSLIILLMATVGISGYNFYIIGGSNWECFTDKCVEYYDKTEFLDNSCTVEDSIGQEVCRFRYQNQDQSVLRNQLEEFPSDHSIFCKSFSCDTKILRRAG